MAPSAAQPRSNSSRGILPVYLRWYVARPSLPAWRASFFDPIPYLLIGAPAISGALHLIHSTSSSVTTN